MLIQRGMDRFRTKNACSKKRPGVIFMHPSTNVRGGRGGEVQISAFLSGPTRFSDISVPTCGISAS